MSSKGPGVPRAWLQVGAILCVSGFCSLVYQVAWFRLLRLVFGASTAATAVVVAIFMGGLGLGGYYFGSRVRRAANPLAFYARLELGIALTAAASPLLVELARALYVGLDGVAGLGLTLATALRLLLAVVILGVPTTLMGGTLPAVAQAMERREDVGRRDVAWLYGLNTLGAVVGAFVANFFFIELLGIRRSLWLAALVNLLIAISARRLAENRPPPEEPAEAAAPAPASPAGRRASPTLRLVLPAAAIVGFIFFLMEIVWYRMLAPVLGGSSYTFGLILTMALLGIGLGGLAYAVGPRAKRPTLLALAFTCALEALCLVVPFAVGDDLAFFAAVVRSLSAAGFVGLVVGWTLVAGFVVLPAALVAGYQFPLLVALLGADRRQVGYEVGLVYAWNTWGAILGSLAGGLGLLPLIGAPRLWRLAAVLLVVLAVVSALAGPLRRRPGRLLGVAACVVLTLLLCLADGPSAFWRHQPIGAGRLKADFEDPNEYRRTINEARRMVVVEAEGVESSVALMADDDLALYVNGKSDGAARGDAGTALMSGLVGAALHPDPRRTLVIGLGTGTTAGWLAAVDTMERVDVVELEPAVIDFADHFRAVNHDVLRSPKVRLFLGDGREYVLTTDESYDIIFSEPSNPYRAGVADLFSRDFYRAVAERLASGGIFLQWLQGYEVDAEVIQIAFTTLGTVFPHIETWQVDQADLLLVASVAPLDHDLAQIRSRVAGEPWRSGMRGTWLCEGLECYYSAFVAGDALPAELDKISAPKPSTDDRPTIEFGFARSVGRHGLLDLPELQRLAEQAGAERPPFRDGALDWSEVREVRQQRRVSLTYVMGSLPAEDVAQAHRFAARRAYGEGDLEAAVRHWSQQPREPSMRFDRLLLAEGLAAAGDPRAEAAVEALRAGSATDHAALVALLRWRRRDGPAGPDLLRAFERAQQDGWFHLPLLRRSLERALEIAAAEPAAGVRLFDALARPFAAHQLNNLRLVTRVRLAARLGFERFCAPAFETIEPHPLWDGAFLESRARCYARLGHPLAARAREDLADFLGEAPPTFGLGLPQPAPLEPEPPPEEPPPEEPPPTADPSAEDPASAEPAPPAEPAAVP